MTETWEEHLHRNYDKTAHRMLHKKIAIKQKLKEIKERLHQGKIED